VDKPSKLKAFLSILGGGANIQEPSEDEKKRILIEGVFMIREWNLWYLVNFL
jgi:hypothetical protein